MSVGRGEPPLRSGEDGLEGYGEVAGKGEGCKGASVKRKSRGSICQNDLLLTNVSAQPVGFRTSVSVPTQESSLAINPIRSSFCKVFLPLKMPSRLILIRQSAFGRPLSGVTNEASVMM